MNVNTCPCEKFEQLQLECDTAIRIIRELRDAIWNKAETVEFLTEGQVSVVRTIDISQQFNAANSFLLKMDKEQYQKDL